MTRAGGPWTVTQIGSRSIGVRTFESRDAWQTVGRLALNFHRRKEWTSGAIGASLSPCRDMGRWLDPGSCPAGDGATAGLRWWRRLVPVATEKDPQMSHSKTPRKTKFARAKSRAKQPAKPGNMTRSGTKQEAV